MGSEEAGVFEKRVFRKTFGPESYDTVERWGTLNKDEFHNFQSAQYIVTDLINALPGDSSVNTVQQATIDEAVFLCPPRRAAVEKRGYATRF
jgi:hypothetical protein